MDYGALEKNITDVLEEQQLKLGYLPETVRLYYPLPSLNRLLETRMDTGQMEECLQDFSGEVGSRLGKLAISREGERFCIAVPPEGAEYVHERLDTDGFLASLLKALQRHGCTMEEIMQQFFRYSDHVHMEPVSDGEFDYLVYFEDGKPDDYRYCFTKEEDHITYHRFSIADYEEIKE